METSRLTKAVPRLVDLVARLRGPGGCPWDAAQTAETIRMYLLEESYEVVDAVERGTPEDLCGELGDLLFQILFLARLAEEKGRFDLADVVEGITRKMIHRHPHVFGSMNLDTPEEVAANWAKIKREEKGNSTPGLSDFDSVPANLPALLRAHRLTQRAAKALPGDEDPRGDAETVSADMEALRTALASGDDELAERRLGDVLFGLAGLAGRRGLNAEDLLRRTNRRFLDRWTAEEEGDRH